MSKTSLGSTQSRTFEIQLSDDFAQQQDSWLYSFKPHLMLFLVVTQVNGVPPEVTKQPFPARCLLSVR